MGRRCSAGRQQADESNRRREWKGPGAIQRCHVNTTAFLRGQSGSAVVRRSRCRPWRCRSARQLRPSDPSEWVPAYCPGAASAESAESSRSACHSSSRRRCFGQRRNTWSIRVRDSPRLAGVRWRSGGDIRLDVPLVEARGCWSTVRRTAHRPVGRLGPSEKAVWQALIAFRFPTAGGRLYRLRQPRQKCRTFRPPP